VTKSLSGELRNIANYKWQFLRKNEDYIKDCEEWSGRKKNLWQKEEIILGYEFKGNFNSLPIKKVTSTIDGLYLKEFLAYFEQYTSEWCDLVNTKEGMEELRNAGFNPVIFPRIGTWRSYWQKWDIRPPLNPYCDFVPFFVEIAPAKIISESVSCPTPTNDPLLERVTTSSISVNWAMPIQDLKRAFEDMLRSKRKFFLHDRIKNKRIQFKLFDTYLKIWNLHKKEKKTFKYIAEYVFPKEYKKELKYVELSGKDLSKQKEAFKKVFKQTRDENLAYEKAYGYENKKTSNKVIQRVMDNFYAAQRLIEGGYKEIG